MDPLREIVQRYWGFADLRPLQAEAMAAVMAGRDSLVVLPTGGGKSLCFQAPALLMPGLAVVVSPLIALMKDQVDALTDNGVPAAFINSTSSTDERLRIAREIREGRLKLLYLSPERLMTAQGQAFLKQTPLSFFAIDEAHCISDWGHDFRPEYRDLAVLKSLFPGVAVHAYTATATERVRGDIVRQLKLVEPEVLVGNFDRPNLVYRVLRRSDRFGQVLEVLDRHPNESGIIYCISRKEVDNLATKLREAGKLAVPYHAGMSDDDRKASQEAFLGDRAQIIVATVAFGMGIDKPDVRYVVHCGVPKSLEAYQQESGRAGRDSLEAECCLFWSAGDFATWRRLQGDLPRDAFAAADELLKGIDRFCSSATCRHKALVNYFGQEYEGGESCGACDICLSEVELVADPLILGQKILSCVMRVNQNFGAVYVANVLIGSGEQRILEQGHDRLSTYGLLKEHSREHVRVWIDQLAEQGYLARVGEYSVLQVTPAGRQLLKGEATPRLVKPAQREERKRDKAARIATVSWEGVDRELFEELRLWRRDKAAAHAVPTFIIFSDATLRDLARRRPSSPRGLLAVQGIGEKKQADYGGELLALLDAYCRRAGITRDVAQTADTLVRPPTSGGALPSSGKQRAMEMFAEGRSPEEVAKAIDRAPSTTHGYLIEFILREGITDPSHWLDAATFARIAAAAKQTGMDKLRPAFEGLGGTVSYEQIKIAFACLKNQAGA